MSQGDSFFYLFSLNGISPNDREKIMSQSDIGNIGALAGYIDDLFRVLSLYEKRLPKPDPEFQEELDNLLSKLLKKNTAEKLRYALNSAAERNFVCNCLYDLLEENASSSDSLAKAGSQFTTCHPC